MTLRYYTAESGPEHFYYLISDKRNFIYHLNYPIYHWCAHSEVYEENNYNYIELSNIGLLFLVVGNPLNDKC